MKILIEGQYYPAELVRELCGDFGEPNNKGELKVSRVGYFFNPTKADCVICLPKVVMFEDKKVLKAFGTHLPQDIIHTFSKETEGNNQNVPIEEPALSFIKDFALWSYRTISTYARLNPKSDIVKQSSSVQSDDTIPGTILDVILMLIKFYNENKDYFMYIIKNIHSGYDRVSWRKTIAKKVPVIQKGSPIYMEAINRKKQINFDEELMIIFYSILNYIAHHLGFDIRFDCNYDLIRGAEFESYIEGVGIVRLKSIKYKYFSDKDLQMWNLCHAFFEKTSRVSASEKNKDYLFVTDFDKVFESMMNALISDNNVPKELIDQKDGKLVDHIFLSKSPLDGSPVYYIGDSKYYKTASEVEGKPLYKQHTYAKNVIQFHFDEAKRGKKTKVTYRESTTEGYVFTPNFFIGAKIPNELNYEDDTIRQRNLKRKDSLLSQFENRLFDRDTLWLSHYDVNLLYVMSVYARNETVEQESFKKSFQEKVYEGFKKMLNHEYKFYWITTPIPIKEFIKEYFYYLNGKVIIPANAKGKLLLAIHRDNHNDIIPEENKTIIEFLKSKGVKEDNIVSFKI